jgi:hypothetical protein
MFQAGGTEVYLHKYLGPKTDEELGRTEATADQPVIESHDVTQIQDLLFLENRDRKYDEEIYKIRGIYNVQNIDFNLSQFGMFIDQDTLYMTVHINDFIKYIGRKPISGDVIELPHLRDDFALGDFDVSLPRYYVIEDVGRASEGFSSTWFPHLYRLKIKKLTDGQQFADIMNQPAKDANGDPDPNGLTLKDLLSTFNKEIAVNDQIIAQAEADAPKSGFETRQMWTLAVDTQGKTVLNTADLDTLDASVGSYKASESSGRPVRTGYTGYLVGDGFPVNGYDFGHGIQFPQSAGPDDFFLRTDFMPNRLFRYDGNSNAWVKVEDAVRMTMTNNDTRQTYKTSFINNSQYLYNDAIASDLLQLPPNVDPVPDDYQYVLNTALEYVEPLYVVFKLETTEIAFVVADYPDMLSNVAGKLTITLPVIDTVQQILPYDGQWTVQLCNNRVESRQALSKVLKYKPEADV